MCKQFLNGRSHWEIGLHSAWNAGAVVSGPLGEKMVGIGILGEELLNILRAPSAGRPFLAGVDESRFGRGPGLTVHAAAASMTRDQARALTARLKAAAGDFRITVKRHPVRSLERARSLETFLRPFAHRQIVFDPAGVFGRGEKLVGLAGRTRRACGGLVTRHLWHSATGTLFILLDPKRLGSEAERRSAFAMVEAAVEEARRHGGDAADYRFVKAVRVALSTPRMATVPVDAMSVTSPQSAAARYARKLYISSIAASFGLGAAVSRADDMAGGPAVSGLNGEFAVMGGSRAGNGSFMAEGAVTHPLGDRFGMRWDGLAGSVDGEFIGGGAAHVFWRDPAIGLVGVAGGYLRSEVGSGPTSETGIIAAEGEVYLDDVTLVGLAGYQFSNADRNDGAIARFDVEWYPHDDLMLSAGFETNPMHDALGRIGAEFRPGFEALPGLTVFAEGVVGDEGYSRAFGGIRFYFGRSTTLKERHRRDTFRSNLLPTRMVDSVDAYGN